MKEDSLKNEGGQLKFNADGTISLPANIEREVKRKTYNFVDEKELDIWDDKGYDDETYHLNDDVSKFNLYDSGERMKALMFSNGLSQGEVVDKVVNLIDEGKKVIFIRGVCGSGKCLSRDTEVFAKPNGKSLFGSYKIFDLVGKTGKILSLDECVFNLNVRGWVISSSPMTVCRCLGRVLLLIGELDITLEGFLM